MLLLPIAPRRSSHRPAARTNSHFAVLLLAGALCSSCPASRAAVLLDDTWSDASRSQQALPAESAWYSSTGSALIATPGQMTLTLGGGAVQGITYFTPNSESSPISLAVGETLRATIHFTFASLADQNGSQGFRLGLFNFADGTNNPKRVSADGFSNNSQGAGVQGYALFQNMGTTFNNASPMNLRKRNNLASTALLGTTGDWASLIAGPGETDDFAGFGNGTLYTLTFVLNRAEADTLVISATWSNTVTAATLAVLWTDTDDPCFSFDGIALRPQNAASAATNIHFLQCRVEHLLALPELPEIVASPQSQTAFPGEDAVFAVEAIGEAPLQYQWFFSDSGALVGATNSTLALTNLQPNQAGDYFAVVTNNTGSATSSIASLTIVTTSGEVLDIAELGNFATVLFRGTPGYEYEVQRSTNLVNWVSLTTIVAPEGGEFVVGDDFAELAAPPAWAYYRLWLVGLAVAPAITSPPQDQSVNEGGNVEFDVTASGSAPLRYQWFYNGSTPLAGATNTTLTINGVQLTDGGSYHVVVTNYAGTASSAAAVLSVIPTNDMAIFDMAGYALQNGGTTGGAGGPTVTVNNLTDFTHYIGLSVPYIVQVSGTINLGGSNVRVRDNKTIIGLGTNATLVGNLKVFRNNNVIIRNLTFTNPGKVGDGDGFTIEDARNVWVDHCTFVDCGDGSLDISHAADWITVSWCKFYYTFNSGHNFVNLVGHSDSASAAGEDTGTLHVTFHHNWYSTLCVERMPRVRFGKVHVFNNYFNSPGNNYCIRAGRDSELLVEHNYFKDVKNTWERYNTTGIPGKIRALDNILENTTWSSGDPRSVQVPGTDDVFTPPYLYTPNPAALVPGLVTNYAGAGRISF